MTHQEHLADDPEPALSNFVTAPPLNHLKMGGTSEEASWEPLGVRLPLDEKESQANSDALNQSEPMATLENPEKVNDELQKLTSPDEDQEEGDPVVTLKLPQMIAAFGANMGAFAFGTVICWSATAVPRIRTDEGFTGPGGLSEAASSWISSIITLGALAACLPTGALVDWIGRRRTMLLASVPFLGGWLALTFAPNVGVIIAARFLTGICGGIFSIAAPMFIAETAEPRIRGMLTSGYDTMTCIGILFQLIAGTFLSWRIQCLVCAVVPIIVFVILIFVPESPRFLLEKKQTVPATISLSWLRGVPKESQLIVTEIHELSQSIAATEAENPGGSRCGELLRPAVLRALSVGFMLFFFQVFTGLFAVMFYRVEIFQSSGVKFDEYLSSIIVGSMDMVASICCASVVDRFGRKVLMVTSELLMALSLVSLGAFFHVKERVDADFAQDTLGWLPLASLMTYVGGYSVGMGALPYSMIPELFPQKVRGLASSILTTAMWAMAFVVGRFFNDLMSAVGSDGVYWFFATCCLLGAVYIFFCVPETIGKTLEEVQLLFQRT